MSVATVIADFHAETTEEISLVAGSVVSVILQEEDGWCIVEFEGSRGVFPGTYLEFASLDDSNSNEGDQILSASQSDSDLPDTESEPDAPEIETEPEPGLSKEESDLKHRLNVIKEIKATEKDYVQDLEIVSQIFIKPLAARSIISREDSSALFSNIEVLLSVNEQLNTLLQAVENEQELMIGEIFVKMADFFKMYTAYCANQPKAMATLERLNNQANFKGFLAECMQNPSCRGLTLFSFLIKPIQRICKYPLLIKDLRRHTQESHPDYENLKIALSKIEEVVAYVNERKRLAENLQKILDVQTQIESNEELNLVSPSRRFVREGHFTVLEKGKPRARNVYLFNDLIVTTKPAKKSSNAKDHFRVQLSLNQARIIDVADTEEIKNACELKPLHADPDNKAYILIFATLEEKQSWVKEIKTLVKEFQIRQLKAKKEGLSLDSFEEPSPPPEQKSSKSRRLRGTSLKKTPVTSNAKSSPTTPAKTNSPLVSTKKSSPAVPSPPNVPIRSGKLKVDRKVQSLVMTAPPKLGQSVPPKPKGKPKTKPPKTLKTSAGSLLPPKANSDFAAQLNLKLAARKSEH